MAVADTSQPHPRLFTVDEYEHLWESAFFGDEERLELIHGVITKLHPRDAAHIWAVSRLVRMMARRDDTVLVSLCPIRVNSSTKLLADAALLPSHVSRRIAPQTQDMLLVVEVADLSIDHDRLTKVPLYAQAGIPEYWIVDLNGDQIEVYREPSSTGYRTMRLYARGETLTPTFAPDFAIQTDAILGASKPASASSQPSADEPAPPADN